ncbi:response regulator [Paenibacillus sp. UMB4589-SE434]|uniref:response regulator n=1 Tax=Paenibacillus sp. UMB4589-SE434 TaxID=3046314 RepID=UPI00254F726D|nr:response regulator [Paenibacillus sp. UMB4589-SE434]MDK8182179.1 response regulator [Paenibacillus sp. UMB4589-SE434]
MRNLLIVDDEAHWVDNLADHKPWNELQIDVVHKAYSPFEALELMDTYPIDLVITDISMPELSGLELIEEIKKRKPNTVCLLLSGYSEFEYAKQAMRLEAFDYLLKPVKDEELFRVVNKAVQQLERRDADKGVYQKLQHSLQENLPLIRSHLLREWLVGKGHTSRWKDQADRYQIPFVEQREVWMMLIRLENEYQTASQNTTTDRSWAEFAVLNIADEWLSPDFEVWGCREEHGYIVLLLQPSDSVLVSAEVTRLLEHMMLGLQQKLKSIAKEPVSLLLTRAHTFPAGVRPAYEQALIDFRRQVGERQELILLESAALHPAAKSMRALHTAPTLLQLLEMSQWELAEQRLSQIFAELSEQWQQSYEHVLIAGMEISTAYMQLIHRNGQYLTDLSPELMASFSSGAPFRSIQALERWSYDMLRLIQQVQKEEVHSSRQSTIRKVHLFIERNLHKDASLRAIADEVHMHPTHLSKIYKLETGQSLSEYMMNVRMDKASRLLMETTKRIYEICEEIGYSDPAYFIKVYKKYYGMTPQEYRERHQHSCE